MLDTISQLVQCIRLDTELCCRNMFAIVLESFFFLNESGHESIIFCTKKLVLLLTTCPIVCSERITKQSVNDTNLHVFSFEEFVILGLASKFVDPLIFTISVQVNILKFHAQCNLLEWQIV